MNLKELKELISYASFLICNGNIIPIREKYTSDFEKRIFDNWNNLPDYKKIVQIKTFTFEVDNIVLHLNIDYVKRNWNINRISKNFSEYYNFTKKEFDLGSVISSDKQSDYIQPDFFLCLDVIEKELESIESKVK